MLRLLSCQERAQTQATFESRMSNIALDPYIIATSLAILGLEGP